MQFGVERPRATNSEIGAGCPIWSLTEGFPFPTFQRCEDPDGGEGTLDGTMHHRRLFQIRLECLELMFLLVAVVAPAINGRRDQPEGKL